jgi:hypothetical protein
MISFQSKLFVVLFCMPFFSCRVHKGADSEVKVTVATPVEETTYPAVIRVGGDCNATFVEPTVALTTADCISKIVEIQNGPYHGQVPVVKVAHPSWDKATKIHPYNIGVLIFSGSSQYYFSRGFSIGSNGEGIKFIGHGCADPARPGELGIKRVGSNILVKRDNTPGFLTAPGLNIDSIHGNKDTQGRSLGCNGDSGAAAVAANNRLVGIWVGSKKIPGVGTQDMNYFIDVTTSDVTNFIQYAYQVHSRFNHIQLPKKQTTSNPGNEALQTE